MANEKQLKHISKFLSLVLRHKPDTIGIELDANGWTSVDDLIQKSNAYGIKYDLDTLKHLVETNNKNRFAFNDNLEKIRASQGHSVNIDLGYSPQQPPEFLFHGTATRFVDSILESGLVKRSRQHVHLSMDLETATKVGQRHGKLFIFKVLANQMFEDQFKFFISENGVWLTDHVPAKYLVEHN
jgi:RNA:NAD 2''-phosphotransferase